MLIINCNTEALSMLKRRPGDNTILYYSFDNDSLTDDSGNNRNGTRYNWAGSFTTGISGKCANMGGSHAIQLPIACPSGDFTYSVFLYSKENSTRLQSILWVQQWGSSGYIHFHRTSSNGIVCSFSNISSELTSGGTQPTLNGRTHIVLTRSGNVWTLYINGVQKGQITNSMSISQNVTRYIGREYTDNRYVNGYIDEVIFENRARSLQDITDYRSKIVK